MQTPRAIRHGAFAFSATFLLAVAVPAGAEDAAPSPGEPPLELEPSERMFDEFGQRMLDSILQSITPDHRAWLDVIKNIDDYDAPEILPNGDVLIRRKKAAPEAPDDAPPGSAGEDADPSDVVDL